MDVDPVSHERGTSGLKCLFKYHRDQEVKVDSTDH